MKITTVTVTNFKRIRDVRITPDADRALILIGGKNGAGKSSTLDALTAAFGGARALPADPVRHGAEEAEIIIQLDGGLTIRRTIAADGTSKLEVRDELGAVKAPQSVLDRIVSGRFLDPLAFLSLSAKDQRAQIMNMIKDADQIVALDAKRERHFSKRTEVGRDLKKAEGELARLPEVEPGEPIDVGELTEETKRFAEKQRAGDALGSAFKEAETHATLTRNALDAGKQRVVALEEQLAAIQKQLDGARGALPTLEASVAASEARVGEAKAALEAARSEWTALKPRREQVESDLARAGAHNGEVYAKRAQADRRKETADAVAKLKKEYDELTNVIAGIETRKAEILAAAQLPVAGLSVTDDGITLNGVPFVQASQAERMRVALGLAIAAAPELGDVWIRDGALLDDDGLELVAQAASAAGKRCWLERVGTRDPGVIVIHDGQVAS